MGDGIGATFARASEALAAALDAQRLLAHEDFRAVDGLRVRMALHTGEAQERDGDYFGPSVNRAARLLAIGHGGQVLISGVTAELLQNEASPDIIDLGIHRLKDLTEPEHIFQLRIDGADTEYSPLLSLDALPNNLPLQLTSFVGRDDELAELSTRLESSRLVTLAGTGGVGKTRLALQLGANLADRYGDGAWFFEFAPLTDPALVPTVVASTLNIRESQDRSVVDSIVVSLARKHVLLIFDNCEQVIDSAAKLTDTILRACRNVSIVTTSRQALGIAGEWVHRVASLPFPAVSRGLNAHDAMEYGAIALFVERATASNQYFQLTDDNAAEIAEVCCRLDGIPFAIELAATRLRALTVNQLNIRLKERFRLLTGGSRTELPRHQTMRALIDWSYDLLEDTEKTLFRRAAIFAGGYSTEAAMSVCAEDPLNDSTVLDLTLSLVEKSLVNAEIGTRIERYRFLESTRDYALEKLKETEEHEFIARKHADFYRRLAEEADRNFFTVPQAEWFALLKREIENLRGALFWSLSDKCEPALGGTLAGSLGRFWYEIGQVSEGKRWIDRALDLLGKSLEPLTRARLWLARAVLTEGKESCESAERACVLYEALGDHRGLGYALREHGLALRQVGSLPEAELALRRSSELLNEEQDAGGFAIALTTLGSIFAFRGDFDAARAHYEKALAAARSHSAEFAVMMSYLHLADLEFQCGNFDLAVQDASEVLDLSKSNKSSRLWANLHGNLAAYRIAVGDLSGAAADAREALAILCDIQNSYQIAIAVQHLALIAALLHDAERAARLVGFVDGYFAKNGLERQPTEAWGRNRIEASLRQQSGPDALKPFMRGGALLSEQEAIDEALQVRVTEP